ncbi:MAG: magnesium/cobalt transporter CorA [Phycisphaeraceae bacterium]
MNDQVDPAASNKAAAPKASAPRASDEAEPSLDSLDAIDPHSGGGELYEESTTFDLPRAPSRQPGTAPGIEHKELAHLPTVSDGCYVTCFDYAPDRVRVEEISDLEDFIVHHRPEWSQVRWINVDGIKDMAVIQALAEKYEMHPLAVEDLLHVPQRPKVDLYEGNGRATRARMVVITRMIELREEHLHSEQITIVLGHKTVLTFQESHGDVWDPIRTRIKKAGSRLRLNDSSFLVYSLLDAIVDHCFPILESYGDRLEELEEEIFEHPSEAIVQQIHQLKRELLLLRRQVWPMREMVHALQREQHECMSENTRVYLRDVYDHAVQIIDLLETYREMAVGLAETYITSISNRMNQVMKVLTIISTVFIPLTFIAGVYGMNFRNMPETENDWAVPWLYPIGFWTICLSIAGGLLYFFKRRGWW